MSQAEIEMYESHLRWMAFERADLKNRMKELESKVADLKKRASEAAESEAKRPRSIEECQQAMDNAEETIRPNDVLKRT